jgi:NitT/TauT family transport system permease protein
LSWLRGPLPPLLTIAAILAGWQLLVWLSGLPSHLLPSPGEVFQRLDAGVLLGSMLPEIAATILSALAGYVVACAVALVLAAVFAEIEWVEAMFYPLVAGFQAVPKVALAPLVLIWAGFGERSEIILVAAIVFFPIFSNAVIGFRNVDPRLVDLMRLYRGSRVFRLRNLSLPSAAGQIFAGLQIAVGFALVGCVAVEFLVGTGGVGFIIQNSANTLDTPSAVAAMLILGVIGACGGLGVRRLKHYVVFWERPQERS